MAEINLKLSVFLELHLLESSSSVCELYHQPGSPWQKKQEIPRRNTNLVIQPVTKVDPQFKPFQSHVYNYFEFKLREN